MRSIGYIDDAVEILTKYELYQYLEDYMNTCLFPSKQVWRNIVVKAIDKHQTVLGKKKCVANRI